LSKTEVKSDTYSGSVFNQLKVACVDPDFDLGHTDRLVGLTMSAMADLNPWSPFGLVAISQACGLPRDEVEQSIATLESRGFVLSQNVACSKKRQPARKCILKTFLLGLEVSSDIGDGGGVGEEGTNSLPRFPVTGDMAAWAKKNTPTVFHTLNVETERFVDYWLTRNTPRADWIASWRNWMRKAEEYRAPKKHASDRQFEGLF